MDETENAIVIQVGERFYNSYQKKRILTAWSLAGAKLFLPTDKKGIEKAEKILHDKRYKTERKIVSLTGKLIKTK